MKSYDHKVDVFAFGALLWELYSEEVPFDGYEGPEIKKALLSGNDIDIKGSVPRPIAKVIRECRKLNPKERPEFARIYEILQEK